MTPAPPRTWAEFMKQCHERAGLPLRVLADVRREERRRMRTDCPRDGHARSLLIGRRLTCPDKKCSCAECHRQLSQAEVKTWKPE